MKKPALPKQGLALCCGIIALVILVGISSALDARRQSNNNVYTEQKNTSASNTTTSSTVSPTKNSTSDADRQVAAAANTQAATKACELLTLSVARQALGSSTVATSASDVSPLQTASTVLTACAYTNTNSTVQLAIRVPSDSLGKSENDMVFGSDKPTGVVTVTGYGQSAYWYPAKQTLNILGSNNWYIIRRSTNTQADAEAVAKLLKAGF